MYESLFCAKIAVALRVNGRSTRTEVEMSVIFVLVLKPPSHQSHISTALMEVGNFYFIFFSACTLELKASFGIPVCFLWIYAKKKK